MKYLSPKQVAEIMGVSESSVKRWVDGGSLQAHVTEGGHRRIEPSAVIRFIRQKAKPLARPDLLGLSRLPADLPDVDAPPGQRAEWLYRALMEDRRDDVIAGLIGRYLAGHDLAEIFDGPVRDVMARLGTLWIDRQEGILFEHRAVTICLQALERLEEILPPLPDDAPLAVGSTPSGDPYFLPCKCASVVLQDQGMRTMNYGPDLPLPLLVAAVRNYHARLAWVSLTSRSAADEARPVLLDIADQLRQENCPLLLGGQASADLDFSREQNIVVMSTMGELGDFAAGFVRAAG